MKILALSSLLAAGLLSGCMVMQDNSPRTAETQQIALTLSPDTAQCQAFQAATPTGTFDPGRKVLTVPRSHDSLEILCFADGYKDKRIVLVADTAGSLGGAAFFLADFGPVDYFYSAYPDQVSIALDPLDAPGRPR